MTSDFVAYSPDYWALFLEFWRFEDANAVWVMVGSVLLGISASVIGGFAFLRKRSLMGDALAHAALPGVMTAFILFHAHSPLLMFFGALVSSFLGLFLMDWIPKHTKIKPDAAMAITLSFFFALGLMELSYIQGMEVAGKSGLDKILFGQAAAMLPSDIYLLSAVALVVLLTVAVFFQKFRLIAFNRSYAQSLGLNIAFYELVLALLIVMSVVIGLQIVGVVLMAAVLLTPVAAARFWGHNLSVMLLTAGFIGGLSGLFSANISYMAPAMPTGPWMVVVLSLVFAVSFLFAPQRGLIANVVKQRRLRRQVCDENVLRTLYVLNERHPANRHHSKEALVLNLPFGEEDILALRTMPLAELKETLDRMKQHGWLTAADTVRAVALSPTGAERAVALTRRHRLWENYLTEQLALTPDRVHSQAEQIEHLLTDEEAQALERELQNSDNGGSLKDPHGRRIPSVQASESREAESR